MKQYAIIVAGGSGQRMGIQLPKQFLPLAGKPVLMHTIEAFHRADVDTEIILVLPASQREYWRKLCKEYKFPIRVTMVAGGNTRFMSVKHGLDAVLMDFESYDKNSHTGGSNVLIAIHDGVRPLVEPKLIRDVFEAARQHKVAYPAVQVVDTLRKVDLDGSAKDVDRSQFKLVQTPQVFLAPVILEAYDYACDSPLYTDDISVVANKMGRRPCIVEGSKENIKITTPDDLELAEAILMVRKSRERVRDEAKKAKTTECKS
ncbi:MAG: 2-C-methyl-D-erythritol 4-phosphate cytidylyltransferase [Candidatus Symbiothrix sp.]|jgi:2-C-methyl-D-erythritol 4-phosphate cytidylyltransferase|nr:2-C-methyl-D-erythritol 4-phosphate cytidylyltransferase [Candidatus Symbiothrix sp.]